jgi:hypothetical protein
MEETKGAKKCFRPCDPDTSRERTLSETAESGWVTGRRIDWCRVVAVFEPTATNLLETLSSSLELTLALAPLDVPEPDELLSGASHQGQFRSDVCSKSEKAMVFHFQCLALWQAGKSGRKRPRSTLFIFPVPRLHYRFSTWSVVLQGHRDPDIRRIW